MIYKYNNNGNIEEIEREDWIWEAHYNDGTFLKQFDDDGWFHRFNEIDQTKLHYFKMIHQDKPSYSLLFNPLKMKLIHYYKRVRLNIGSGDDTFFSVYCFGYETKMFNRTSKVNIMIMPTGETIVCEDSNLIEFN